MVGGGYGQIKINGLCLDLPPSGSGVVVLNSCTGVAGGTQTWGFLNGRIHNWVTKGCLYDSGGNDFDYLAVTANGSNPTCSNTGISDSMWMPVGVQFDFTTRAGYWVKDLEQNYNSENNDTAVSGDFLPPQAWDLWQYNVWSNGCGTLIGAEGYALDLWDNYIEHILRYSWGYVDLATPQCLSSGTPQQQQWYLSMDPSGYAQFENGNVGYCLTVDGNDTPGTPLDLQPCSSGEASQLFSVGVDGFDAF